MLIEEVGDLELDGDCLLEQNPGESIDQASGDAPILEVNSLADANAITPGDEDEDEEWWEIPYSSSAHELPQLDEVLEIRLFRKGDERLGLVLDADNVVVALREGTPAAHSGELFVGDKILAVQGEACSADRRVAQILRELPDAAVYAFRVRRALSLDTARARGFAMGVEGYGPLLTPEEQKQFELRELEQRQKMRESIEAAEMPDAEREALLKQLGPRNLTETKYMSEHTEMSAAARQQMEQVWRRQARSNLAHRLNAAEMLKDEGNDKFSEGEYHQALEEYEYALELFKYEMANLCRDQEQAELGDHKRGLSSDDLPNMNRVRVPCLLNSAACHLKLGGKGHWTKALECCAEVLQAGPPAAQRAKAHFRIGQAHFALQNYREAWEALLKAQELNPGSREVRSLLSSVSYELKQLKVAERESREGMMGTELNHKQILKQEKMSYAQRIQLLRKLLPSRIESATPLPNRMSRGDAEVLLEEVAAKGWANLSSDAQLAFSSLWSSGQPRLGASEVRDGRDAGVFPPRDEDLIFGQNLPHALMSKPFPEALSWLTPTQRQYARGLALTIWKRGAEDLDDVERRLCEGLELLAIGPHTARWHAHRLGAGGAQLILAPVRAPLWPFLPPTLRVQPAVMGAELDCSELARIQKWSRRSLTPGEVGIICSNVAAWRHTLDAGWEWCLVLEDDASVRLNGGALQLLALLPELAAAAAVQEADWQLVCLSPHGLEPFYGLCDPEHIPGLMGDAVPAWARKPRCIGESGWRRVGPTFHAFGWLYRASLIRRLLNAWEAQTPPLNPIDVWVWEVMAASGVLDKALAPTTPLVLSRDTPGGATSVRLQQSR